MSWSPPRVSHRPRPSISRRLAGSDTAGCCSSASVRARARGCSLPRPLSRPLSAMSSRAADKDGARMVQMPRSTRPARPDLAPDERRWSTRGTEYRQEGRGAEVRRSDHQGPTCGQFGPFPLSLHPPGSAQSRHTTQIPTLRCSSSDRTFAAMVKDGHTCRRGCARSGHRIALAPAWSNEIGVRFARLTWSLKTSRREWCPLTSNLRWDRCCGIDIDLRHRQSFSFLIRPACKVPSGL